MKGLKKIPSTTQRLKAYKALQFSPHSVQIKELALWSQWVRLDPRLGEILVRHLGQFWSSINPQELNQTLQKQIWPSAFGVLVEQTLYYLVACEKPYLSVNLCVHRQKGRGEGPRYSVPNKRPLLPVGLRKTHFFTADCLEKSKSKAEDTARFCRWSKLVMHNIAPAPDELFFIGLYKAGGKKMKEEWVYSIKPYRKWGYFAKDWLINKAQNIS